MSIMDCCNGGTVSAAICTIISLASLAASSRAGFMLSKSAWRILTSSAVVCNFPKPRKVFQIEGG